jgi:hypothetical protein
MAQQWEYRVAYVDPRGRISCEGTEVTRQSGETRTACVRRYLDGLGNEGWELVGIHPLGGAGAGFRRRGWGAWGMAGMGPGVSSQMETGYYVLKRPKAEAAA